MKRWRKLTVGSRSSRRVAGRAQFNNALDAVLALPRRSRARTECTGNFLCTEQDPCSSGFQQVSSVSTVVVLHAAKHQARSASQ